MTQRKDESIDEYRIRHTNEERERRKRLGDLIKIKGREYYWNDPEKARETARRSYDKNSDKRVKQKREYRKNNPEKIVETTKKYYDKNKSIILSKRNKEKQLFRNQLIEYLGGRCVVCNTIDKLEIDHIYGGGRWEVNHRFKQSGWMMYKYYINNLDEAKFKLQVLCEKHNLAKRTKNKEYGGEYKKAMDETYK